MRARLLVPFVVLFLTGGTFLFLSGCASGQMAQNVPADVPDENTARAPAPEVNNAADDDPDDVPDRYELEPSPAFQQSVRAGTRTMEGLPGAAYWQQEADYDIDVRLLTDEKRLEGTTDIEYTNDSPNTLRTLQVQLILNVHKEGVPRNRYVPVTGGINLESVEVDGRNMEAGIQGPQDPGYLVQGTQMVIVPNSPVSPGETVELSFEWNLEIPQQGAGGRMGYSRDDLFYLAYFYPKMQVYDDITGWFNDPFRGNAEFYFGYGDYDISITAPQDWVVMGTGALQNASEVLQPDIVDRMDRAYDSDEPVMIMEPADDGNVTAQGSEWLTWEFTADDVRDVAFTATRGGYWEAARTEVGDRDDDGEVDYTKINTFWRETAPLWSEVTGYQQHSIRFLSNYTGLSYAYPHMTAVEGTDIIGGGMEFPMMTIMGPYTTRGDTALYAVTVHELAHMWVPMMISTNERRFSWFDEGNTSFLENQAKVDYYPGVDFYGPDARDYLTTAARDMEGPIMRRSDFHYPGPAYVIASYRKPATLLHALRGLLGEDTFMRAYQAFHQRWAFHHPYPQDFFNTIEDVSGRDLDWFWRSFYYETWTLDQAVIGVEQTDGRSVITVENQSDAVMPVDLAITLASGETIERQIPVDTWLGGGDTATLTVDGRVTRVEIDPAVNYPDIERADNVWER